MNKHTRDDMKQMQSLPLEAKIAMTKARIKAWYEAWTRFGIKRDDGRIRYAVVDTRNGAEPKLYKGEHIESGEIGGVYVSFSGGKDSTVLKHIVDSMYDDVPAVFVNTGLEYPEIQNFVRSVKNGEYPCFNPDVTIVRPEMRFDEVIAKYGYPIITKKISHAAFYARKPDTKSGEFYSRLFDGAITDKKTGKKSMFCCDKWKFVLQAPFQISDRCCGVMKKLPLHKYSKDNARVAITATMAAESNLRLEQWIIKGCNAFDNKNPISNPMSFWTEQDVLQYIKRFEVPYCKLYGEIVPVDGQFTFDGDCKLQTTGCDRTGCIFCAYGAHLEKHPNRFEKLKETHPKQYAYCIEGGQMIDEIWQPNTKGLGMGKVLDFINVKY